MRTSYTPHTQIVNEPGEREYRLRVFSLPSEEDYTRKKSVGGVTASEMVKIADHFQAKEFYENSLAQFCYAFVIPSRASLLLTTMYLMY